ncbi:MULTISPECIES: TetR/AcrR family transcriptional regulator [Microbacterium]|uniref:HTH-type transcriptional repressor BepR n=1 Tax=Microbacterium trichothecenolyticum TaxID=69370 RepID=A0A0M2HB83_MICTR|nr:MULTISPECIES: TetR/AcrR family transcriptional regulator [Microbacterium]KJL41447.1 HTH-type transcriptional repressor BepR [Microbacterium trichothecenolyticum]MDR7190522.1 AcrR family transcriptional regulator [Microbacterium sp. BE35]
MTRSRESRTLILDAAERLFAERGFDATPTTAIADLAGVPKGLLFYYFPTKTDLLRALVGERLDLDPIDTSGLIARGDPAQTLLNVTDRLRELQAESAVRRVIVWREHRTHPEVREKLHDYRSQLQAIVERVLGASILHPIAARRVRTAAAAWVAIITTPTLLDHVGKEGSAGDDAAETVISPAEPADLPALADLISAGLRDSAA